MYACERGRGADALRARPPEAGREWASEGESQRTRPPFNRPRKLLVFMRFFFEPCKRMNSKSVGPVTSAPIPWCGPIRAGGERRPEAVRCCYRDPKGEAASLARQQQGAAGRGVGGRCNRKSESVTVRRFLGVLQFLELPKILLYIVKLLLKSGGTADGSVRSTAANAANGASRITLNPR